jgi:hypothetical protein
MALSTVIRMEAEELFAYRFRHSNQETFLGRTLTPISQGSGGLKSLLL